MSLIWYAARTKKLANSNRMTSVLGAEFESYKNRQGQKCHRRVKDTGRRQFVVETLLERSGFEVFLPVKKRWRRVSKYSQDKQLVAYPLLVGWVFVGWNGDPVRWSELMGLNVISGVACQDGRPCQVGQAAMDGMFKSYGGKHHLAPDHHQFMATHQEFSVGSETQIASGPLDGLRAKVVDLTGGTARAVIEIFGGPVEIEIDARLLEVA